MPRVVIQPRKSTWQGPAELLAGQRSTLTAPGQALRTAPSTSPRRHWPASHTTQQVPGQLQSRHFPKTTYCSATEGRNNPLCLPQVHAQFFLKNACISLPSFHCFWSFLANYSCSVMSVVWKSWHTKHGTIGKSL